eukprot:COSAG01_NODE_239_length_20670_cov_28.609790_5_plen_94_part_00
MDACRADGAVPPAQPQEKRSPDPRPSPRPLRPPQPHRHRAFSNSRARARTWAPVGAGVGGDIGRLGKYENVVESQPVLLLINPMPSEDMDRFD